MVDADGVIQLVKRLCSMMQFIIKSELAALFLTSEKRLSRTFGEVDGMILARWCNYRFEPLFLERTMKIACKPVIAGPA